MIEKDTIQKELTRLYKRDGYVKPTILVKEATRKTSPIHDCFEWDDGKAAVEHRLWQARHMIRIAVVTFKGKEDRFVHVPRIVVKGESSEGEYHPIRAVVKTIGDYERCLNELLSKIHAIQQTVNELGEASGKHAKKNHVLVLVKSLSVAENAIQLLRAG